VVWLLKFDIQTNQFGPLLSFNIRSDAITDSLETKVDAMFSESKASDFKAINANGEMGMSNDDTTVGGINTNAQAGVQEHEH
jgi:hypothetical protein